MYKYSLRRTIILIFLMVFCLSYKTAMAGEKKSFSKTITSGEAEYTIEVSGTANPENLEIVIENLGDEPVVDPRITVNSKYDWFDVNSMVAEITEGCKTDEEKAMAIWQWVHWKRFQRSPHDESANNPVRNMNGYGYGICGHTAAWIKALATAAGLKARVWEIAGHTVSEIFYDNGWHMLDGNVKVFYLSRDNRTVAGMEELMKDKWLIERTIHPRDPWVRQKDIAWRNREFVRYLITERDNWISDGYDSQALKDYKMSLTLMQGAKLSRWWEPKLGKFEGADKSPLVPQRYANGQLIWEPDLRKIDLYEYIDRGENITTRHRDGQDPAIHMAYLQDEMYRRPARFSLPVRSPYPVVGGQFWCTLVKEDGSGQASVSFGHPWKGERTSLYNFRWGEGEEKIELNLDPCIIKAGPVYDHYFTFHLRGNAKNNTQAGVDGFKVINDLQVSPHSLPALSLGKNVIRYRDSSHEGRKVRITHTWREVDNNSPPGKVSGALSPGDGKKVKGLTPVLKWAPATDADKEDKVSDYQVMISLRPDCRWQVSPTLYQSLGSDKCEWQVPESFLIPATTYYWRVRGRDSRGMVGPWGKIFSFQTAPGAN
ncbi:transglutaminase domain-containing protein [Gemmatimonadota bacterium]